MARVLNTPPTGGFAQLKAPRYVLAAPAEFIYDDGAPVAHRTMFGANWVGWDTLGTVISASEKREGTEANLDNANGGVRGVVWTEPGWSAELTVQHDRAMTELDIGDVVTLWVKGGGVSGTSEIPEKKRFYVSGKGSDAGNNGTCMYKVSLKHKEGLMTETSLTLVRAKMDQYGRVIEYTTGVRFDAAAVAPGSALPSSP